MHIYLVTTRVIFCNRPKSALYLQFKQPSYISIFPVGDIICFSIIYKPNFYFSKALHIICNWNIPFSARNQCQFARLKVCSWMWLYACEQEVWMFNIVYLQCWPKNILLVVSGDFFFCVDSDMCYSVMHQKAIVNCIS